MTEIYLQPQLPQQFADQLLHCEIQFELNEKITTQMVMKLIELYRIGIEYYESIRSYKYLYFQRKMNSIVKSERILNNLNEIKKQKPKVPEKQQIIIQSLTDFKKQQITPLHSTLEQTPQQKAKKSSHPFKRHLEQKFQSKLQTQRQHQNLTQRQKQQRQNQLKRLVELQHKEKQQQFTIAMNNVESDKEIKKFIDTETKKLQFIESKVGKLVQDQEEDFRKKLEERRQRVKSNTEKKRMTKSFSNHCPLSNEDLNSAENAQANYPDKDLQNCELKISVESKTNRTIPNTKQFLSFVEGNSFEINEEDYSYEEISQESLSR